jgi:glycine/D-amino acid oxidase-like deaminating enzyme
LLSLANVSTAPRRVVWAPDCYCVPWPNGHLLVGATVEDAGFNEQATLGGVRHLAAAVSRLFPGLEHAELESVRVGLRPRSPDGLPIVGASAQFDGLVYAAGHYRNGILLAPLTARVVADLIASGREDPMLEVTAPARLGL